MLLLDLKTRSFRNLVDQETRLGRHTTVLFGANGQGKTNFLEACYLLCTLRPLRAQKLFELVRIGGEEARILGRFELPGGLREVEVLIQLVAIDGDSDATPPRS